MKRVFFEFVWLMLIAVSVGWAANGVHMTQGKKDFTAIKQVAINQATK